MRHPDISLDNTQHAKVERLCYVCGRAIKGNAYFTHLKTCERKGVHMCRKSPR